MPHPVLVLGGGPAGLQAALDVADYGLDVIVVEKDDFLGGNVARWKYKVLMPYLRPASEVLGPLISRVESHPKIQVLKSSMVTGIRGSAGEFDVEVRDYSNTDRTNLDFKKLKEHGSPSILKAASIIVASGFEHFDSRRDPKYGYGLYPDVIDIKDLELMIGENRVVRPSNGQPPQKVGFVFCVGSRDRHVGNTYCCTVCCAVSIKQAMELKELYPSCEVFCFYMDVRTIGFWEDIYWKSMEEQNIQYVKGRVAEISTYKDRLMVKGEDTLLRGPFEVPFDLIVLASGMEPGKGTRQAAEALGLPLEEHGFIQQKHPQLYPFNSTKEGLFLCGACTGPKAIEDSVVSGAAAAMKAVGFMRGLEAGKQVEAYARQR